MRDKSNVTILIESLHTTLEMLQELLEYVEESKISVDRITRLETRIAEIESTIDVASSLSELQRNMAATTPARPIPTPLLAPISCPQVRSTGYNIVDVNRGLFESEHTSGVDDTTRSDDITTVDNTSGVDDTTIVDPILQTMVTRVNESLEDTIIQAEIQKKHSIHRQRKRKRSN